MMSTETKAPTQEMLDAYEHGRRHQGEDLMALAYSDDAAPSWWMEDDVMRLWWHAGYEGEEQPRWVEAERYGDIPEAGVSRNHAEQSPERGVSVARLLDGSDDYRWYMGWAGGDSRPVVRIAGWLHYRRGGDGEPLLVGAVRI